MHSNGKVGDRVDTRDWASGWSQAQPFQVDGEPFLFLLKQSDGHVHIYSIND